MRTATLLIALLSYTLLLGSVFRVTYDSALQSTVPTTWAAGAPISKIVVIIIIDGLGQRAWDYTISNRSSMLKNITRKYGISGIVKANAPTESRPRHTAVLAGFEEDIANIKTVSLSKNANATDKKFCASILTFHLQKVESRNPYPRRRIANCTRA
ncbi:hypothetical protein SprV_0200732000 [Sparganum proliferum]